MSRAIRVCACMYIIYIFYPNIFSTRFKINLPLAKLWNAWSSIGPAAPLTCQTSGLVLPLTCVTLESEYYQQIFTALGSEGGGLGMVIRDGCSWDSDKGSSEPKARQGV